LAPKRGQYDINSCAGGSGRDGEELFLAARRAHRLLNQSARLRIFRLREMTKIDDALIADEADHAATSGLPFSEHFLKSPASMSRRRCGGARRTCRAVSM
jgi:hypothetical protein